MESDSNNVNGNSLKTDFSEEIVSNVEVKISSGDLKLYPTKTKRLAVIIEMHNVNPLTKSPPTEELDIKCVLEGLGFNIEICDAKNQTKKELPTYLKNIKGKITNETDCFFLVLKCLAADEDKKNEFKTRNDDNLSQWYRCKDDQDKNLSLWTDVVEKFNNENCKELINVPKIFVLQLFRDPNGKDNVIPTCDQKLDQDSKLPTWTDMLVCNSKIYNSYKGFHPVENPPVVGSKFMEFFCKALQERGRGNDICKLLDLVSEMMKVQMKHQSATQGENEFSQYYNIGLSKAYRFPLNPPATP